MARNYPTHSAQSTSESESSVSANAVASTRKGASQLFTLAVLDGVRILEALVDTGSSFSIVSFSMYEQLQELPAILSFTGAAPDVVGVGGARAKICGYVDLPLELDCAVVHHPLLVVEGLAFSLLIGMDIFRKHGPTVTFDVDAPLRLRNQVCEVCCEQRTNLTLESHSAPLTACAVSVSVIEPSSASIVPMRVPRALRQTDDVAIGASVSSTLKNAPSFVGANA